MRARYEDRVFCDRFVVKQLHKAWRKTAGKIRYFASDDLGSYLSSAVHVLSDVTSARDDTMMLWPPTLAGASNERPILNLSRVLQYVLAVNSSLGIVIEYPDFSKVPADDVDYDFDARKSPNLSISKYSSGTPSNLSYWMAVFKSEQRPADHLENISSADDFDSNSADKNVDFDRVSIRICSPVSDVPERVYDEDILQLDVKRFGTIENLRNDPGFRSICHHKFNIFAREIDFRPFVMVLEREKITRRELQKNISIAPTYLKSDVAPAMRFWLCAWWRYLYGGLNSITQFMAYGGILKRDKDMFRVAGSIGPGEFRYMVPSDFLQINDVAGNLDWNQFVSFNHLYSSVFDV